MKPTIKELEKILNDPDAPAVEITPEGEVVGKGLRHEIQHALNKCCAEKGSNTPDYVLAAFLVSCLAAFDRGVTERDRFYRNGNQGEPLSEADQNHALGL